MNPKTVEKLLTALRSDKAGVLLMQRVVVAEIVVLEATPLERRGRLAE